MNTGNHSYNAAAASLPQPTKTQDIVTPTPSSGTITSLPDRFLATPDDSSSAADSFSVTPGNSDITPPVIGMNRDGKCATALDLCQYWSTIYTGVSRYPDYICGVWSVDGTTDLMFAVTENEAGEAGKQEILDLVEDDSTVSFTYLTYTYAELRAIQSEVTAYLSVLYKKGELHSWSVGVDESENVVGVMIGELETTDIKAINAFLNQFGDKVVCEYGCYMEEQMLNLELEGSLPFQQNQDNRSSKPTYNPWIFCLIAILFLFGAFMIFRRKMIPVTVTGRLKNLVNKGSLTKKQVETEYRENILIPSQSLDDKILSTVDEVKIKNFCL